jgi:hypothetical protein
MIRLPVLSALVAIAACASGGLDEDELLGQAPVVNMADVDGMGDREAAMARDAAREAFVRGDDRECLRIVREALDAGAPEPVAAELRALRYEARRRLLSREVVEARIVPRRDFVVFGEDIVLDLSLHSVGSGVLRVPVSDSGASDAMFVLDWTRRDFDIFGNELSVSGRDVVALPGDIDLGPGEGKGVEFRLTGDRTAGSHRGITVIDVSGIFRPSVIVAGEDRYYESVDARGASVRLLPPGYEPIAEDPVGTLRKAITMNAREHLLVAGELAPRERRREVVDILLAALGAGVPEETGRSISVVLGRVTGEKRPAEPMAWLEWMREGGPDGLR